MKQDNNEAESLIILKRSDMICFQCHCDITPQDNGMCINEGTMHEMYQCNDCHYSEFGFNITGSLLVFK